jgi:signal-transduction protein with cAMP-binding, CBS, and nucleotidyltransferase domain
VEQIARNETPGNIIDISQLTRTESVILKQHLHTITGLQTRLHSEFSSEQNK